MTMTIQEFYSEADVIVELHKAYGNIIDWDKERPVNWGASRATSTLSPCLCCSRTLQAGTRDGKRDSSCELFVVRNGIVLFYRPRLIVMQR